jgi:hypothetical protein
MLPLPLKQIMRLKNLAVLISSSLELGTSIDTRIENIHWHQIRKFPTNPKVNHVFALICDFHPNTKQ